MQINENAPANISQCPATRSTDNETGFDPASEKTHEKQPTSGDMPVTPPLDQEQIKPVPGDVI